jgi:hypothetical protein
MDVLKDMSNEAGEQEDAQPDAGRADMRWSVKQRHGLGSVEPLHAGVYTVVQRFRSDLGLYVHLHSLVTDGAFEEAGADVRFLPTTTPTPERMTALLAQVHKAPKNRPDLGEFLGRRSLLSSLLGGGVAVRDPSSGRAPNRSAGQDATTRRTGSVGISPAW